jgi:hypothetical protein
MEVDRHPLVGRRPDHPAGDPGVADLLGGGTRRLPGELAAQDRDRRADVVAAAGVAADFARGDKPPALTALYCTRWQVADYTEIAGTSRP